MDVIARLLDCDGQADDAVSAYTQVRMEDAPRWFKIPKSKSPDVLDTSSTTQMAEIPRQTFKILWYISNELFMNTFYWDAQNVNANQNETIIDQFSKMFESRVTAEATEKYRSEKSPTQKQLRGPATWKDMLEHALSSALNWQTRMWSNFTQFRILAWTTISSKRKNLNQLENNHKCADKLC